MEISEVNYLKLLETKTVSDDLIVHLSRNLFKTFLKEIFLLCCTS